MLSPQHQVQRSCSSHVMETTGCGRPFVKDLHDMFSTLIISMPMEAHKNLFGSYENSFTSEEAIANLRLLKLIRSKSILDQDDSSKIITTTTITKFTMTKCTAKTACQTFLDARLFENLLDPNSRSFKDKSIYGLTPKGIYVLERFILINNLKVPHLSKIFSSKSIKIRLFGVERNRETDYITLSKQNVESVFRRFAGSKPNIVNNESSINRNLGIELRDYQFNNKTYHYTFSGMSACDWLCDFTTFISKDEAKKIATEFIRRGLIKPINNNDSILNNKKNNNQSKLKYSKSSYYTVLEKGKAIALWKYGISRTSTLSTLLEIGNVDNSKKESQKTSNEKGKNDSQDNDNNNNPKTIDEKEKDKNNSQVLLNENNNNQVNNNNNSGTNNEEGSNDSQVLANNKNNNTSNTQKLQQILDDQNLCSLFMNFSKSAFCEENLIFLLEIQKFKECVDTKEQKDLIADALKIYNAHLGPNSLYELSIDYRLKKEIVQYMNNLTANDRKDSSSSQPNPITSHLYDKIQDAIYRFTATVLVPKFIKTKEYLNYESTSPSQTLD